MEKMYQLNRLIIPFILLLGSQTTIAQQEFDGTRGTRHWMMFTDAPNALYHHLASQAYAHLDKRNATIASLHNLTDWKKRQQWIASTLSKAVGPFPSKTPLNAKVVRTISKDGYRIEHIIYESQPGYYVTASLFLPETLPSAKAPAIVYCSGHTENGYRGYQNIIINLAKKGFIVLAFDPMGQGERLEYFDSTTGKSRLKYPTHEHSYVGAQLFITGNTLARNFIWDGIRAVDYLLTRKEVDPARIGITGRSGGGTQSAYIAAFDSRIKAAAPENYITNFKRLYQSIGPQDAEQNFLSEIQLGLDMADLLTARAPKPTLMITTTRDMFPIQGSLETAEEVKKIYTAYGDPQNFRMITDDAPHASTRKNREAMYAFFQKTLANPGDSTDQEISPLDVEDLRVTTTGQVATSLKSETAFSLNKKNAEQRMAALYAVRKSGPGYIPKILEAAKNLSGYREPKSVADPVFTGQAQRNGYIIQKYFIKGEGTYAIPYLLLKPETGSHRALLYLHPSGKTAAVESDARIEWFVRKGFTVLIPDMIGTGEVGPGIFNGDSYIDSIPYNTWFASILVGRSITGIRAGDVTRLIGQLKKDNSIKEIYGLAVEQMAPVLLHAAAFDKRINRVALITPYSSYRSIVMNSNYQPTFLHSTVAGAIGQYDLPDLAASLAPRKLLLSGATDGSGSSADTINIKEDIEVIKAYYGHTHASNELQIVPENDIKRLIPALDDWIKED